MKLERQFLKFVVIGCKSALISYLIYIVLYKITFNIVFASISGYFFGFTNSFFFGKKWVFKNLETTNYSIVFKFFIVYLFGAFLMTFIVSSLSEYGIDYRIAWFLGAIISALNNFLGIKFIVFKKI